MHEISPGPERSHEVTETVVARRDDEATQSVAMINRLTWFLVALACLLLVRYFVPYFAEQIVYSTTRGRQRAELEAAQEGLQQLPLQELSKAYQLISQRVGPSVVHIRVASMVTAGPRDELDALFGVVPHEAQGQGSGVIVDQSGYIVTNNHVVAGATDIQVSLSDGRVVGGKVVGVDALTDLALLKIDAPNLTAAEWGDSDDLHVGALV